LGVGGIDAGGGHTGNAGRTGGSGGGSSFQQLYNESFGRTYDFALRVLRDREEAALAVQASYLAVYQELQAGEVYPSFEVQLFAAAHRDISDRLRRRRGPQPESTQEEAFDTPDPVWASDPAVANEASDLARMAWQVASAARPEELEPLDLQVRQGLNDEEIAAVLRTRPETVRQRVGRLQQGLEDSFSALLLTHRGRRACVDLDFLVGEEKWSQPVRRRVLKHLQTCQICRRTRMSYPPAANVYAALQPVEAPRGWREAMLARLEELVGGAFGPVAAFAATSPQPRPAPPPPPTTQRTGAAVLPPPGPIEPPPTTYGSGGGGMGGWVGGLFASGDARGPLLAMLLGAMLVVIIVLAALCSAGTFGGGDGGNEGTTTPTTTGTITRTPSPTRTSTPTRTPTLPPIPATQTPPPPPPPTAVPPTNPPPPPPTVAPPPTQPPPPTNTQPPVVTPPP
jgi:DNA-directed RNA polymerase specialized sigma24 family protein